MKTVKKFGSIIRVVVVVAVLTIIGFLPIPYELERVGQAISAEKFIKVNGGRGSVGEFMVTSVQSSNARVFTAFLALLPDYTLESTASYVVPDDFDEKEYLENSSMSSAQINALLVAYNAAGRIAKVQYEDAYVEKVSEESSFKDDLKKGDIIVSVNNQPLHNPYDIMEYIQTQKAGDLLDIDFQRDGRLHTASAVLLKDKETGQVDPGFRLNMQRTIVIDPMAKFEDNGVGGPSGGLMFSLEIYNQLMQNDLTKGKIIAGTGTIDRKGNVGSISGVDKKVIAADRAGAEIFFVPDSSVDAELASLNKDLRTNYREAVRTAIDIGSDMKIVPVKTFNDALIYLRELP